MRESRLYGSEGGGAYTLPTPIKMCAVKSAVPRGTGLILLILPRADVLGYFHAVPPGCIALLSALSNRTVAMNHSWKYPG